MESIADVTDELAFYCSQVEIIVHTAVCSLTRIAPDHDDGHVICSCVTVDRGAAHGNLGIFLLPQQYACLAAGTVEGHLGLVVADVLLVIVHQFLRKLEPGMLQAFLHVHCVGLVHVSGAGSASHEINGRDAVQGDLLDILEGKGPVILEEDHGLCRSGTGHLCMSLEVRLVGVLVAFEAGSSDNVLKHVTDIAVKVSLRDGTVLDTGYYPLDLSVRTRFHKVITGIHGRDCPGLGAPVSHHNSIETEVIPKDAGKQAVALLGEVAIDPVVGGHDGPGLSLAHCYLEILEVDLTKGAGGYAGIVLVAVGLLIVGCIVLYRHAYAIGLDTVHICRGDVPGKDRILGEVLEVTAAERVAMDVHSRSEKDVDPVLEDFIAHCGSHLPDKVHIP